MATTDQHTISTFQKCFYDVLGVNHAGAHNPNAFYIGRV
jgi:hypothetical protein